MLAASGGLRAPSLPLFRRSAVALQEDFDAAAERAKTLPDATTGSRGGAAAAPGIPQMCYATPILPLVPIFFVPVCVADDDKLALYALFKQVTCAAFDLCSRRDGR